MQKNILKAGEKTNYYVAMATIGKDETGNYVAILTICDPKKRGKYVVSELKVSGRNKSTIVAQVKAIAKIFPPEKDTYLLDVEEILKNDEA